LKNRLFQCFLSVVLFVVAVGCVSQHKSNPVELAPNLYYLLSSPPAILDGKSHSQLIEATFQGQHHSFIAQVEYQTETISMAAMSVTGVPLFDIIWQNDQPAQISQYVPLPGLDINYVISDIQWVNWPLATLKSSLSGNNVTVTQRGIDGVCNLLIGKFC